MIGEVRDGYVALVATIKESSKWTEPIVGERAPTRWRVDRFGDEVTFVILDPVTLAADRQATGWVLFEEGTDMPIWFSPLRTLPMQDGDVLHIKPGGIPT